MSTVAWRRLLILLCAAGLILNGAALWMYTIMGTSGIAMGNAALYGIPGKATKTPFVVEIIGVMPGSAAQRAGLKRGDLVDTTQLSAGERFRWYFGSWRAGTHVHVPVVAGNGTHWHTMVAEPVRIRWDVVVGFVAGFWLMLFAALIAWRRPENGEARALALLLVLYSTGSVIQPGTWISPWPALDAAFAALGWILEFAGFAMLATYAMLVVARTSLLRSALAWLSYGTAGVSAMLGIAYTAGVWSLRADPTHAWYSSTPITLFTMVPLVAAALCALVAVAQAKGAERARMAWVSAALVPMYLAYTGCGVLTILDSTSDISGVLVAVNVTNFVAPFGLTYALFNRRILGAGFAMSRAMVFSAVSLIVVGLFVLIEWQVGVWFSAASRTVNLAITGVLAAGLALSSRALYARIDGFVDTVLFKKQRDARALVARMIAGLPYVESVDTIADVLAQGTCEGLRLASCALFRRGERGTFELDATYGWAPDEQIVPSDVRRLAVMFEGGPALLELSAFPFAHGQMPAGLAAPIVGLPLYVRRQLAGFALYSGPADGTALDPDERALLVELAAGASRAYDALELAARVEKANEARELAQAENLESLKVYSEACERFVPGEFLKLLAKDSLVGVHLGDHVQREMAVLFADIRSFTSISERMSPEQTFTFLNEYLHRTGPLIREHGGFIDKYIGDAVMSLFPNSPDDALRAAIALQHEVRLFNRYLDEQGIAPITVGVGVHHGELMLGTIGERGRMETTVISDAVNVASRLETATKQYGCSILLSRQTVTMLSEPHRFMLRPLGCVQMRGKALGVEIYECYDADPADLAWHKRTTEQHFARARGAFEAGDPIAYEEFRAILAGNQRDGAAAYFVQRCEERFGLSNQPIPITSIKRTA